jgi:hypothetical protein
MNNMGIFVIRFYKCVVAKTLAFGLLIPRNTEHINLKVGFYFSGDMLQ